MGKSSYVLSPQGTVKDRGREGEGEGERRRYNSGQGLSILVFEALHCA